MNKAIIVSLALIAAVGVVATGATVAYFTDEEISTGNTFTAGCIDLKIDNDAWYNGEHMPQFSWTLKDLTNELFFSYDDLKPGDWEEDTISLHVDNNDAWVCANITITEIDDVSCTEPEMADDPSCDEPNAYLWDGDLGFDLHFIFWADDGDNVLETDENIILEGTPSDVAMANASLTFPIVDSVFNLWGGSGPLTGGTTVYIGKAFCFGDLVPNPVPACSGQNPGVDPGFTCDGALVNNRSQSDSVVGNISFTAIQSRNNPNYVCGQ